MDVLDLKVPRSGGLMLCECGHLKSYHADHPMWHGGPLHHGCVLCHVAGHRDRDDCQEFKAGSFQGYKLEQGVLRHE